MKVLDGNILIYAVNRQDPNHAAASAWLEAAASESETIGLPWSSIVGFLRVVTNRVTFPAGPSVAEATAVIERLLELPTVRIIEPGRKHLAILKSLLVDIGVGGNLLPDAHLAALAIENNATICSRDRDFARFSGVKWIDPLAA